MALSTITDLAITTLRVGWEAFQALVTDLASTDNAKGASQIGIEDTAANYDATDVEGALAEVYTDHSVARSLAEIFNEDPATTTGLTWGYKAGAVRYDNTITDVSAGTISLTDDATNYISIDPTDGTVSRNTTVFTAGEIPLREVVCASGVQTDSTDKRAWYSGYPTPIPVAKGGTGNTTALTNGQLFIGNTGNDLTLGTLTASDGIGITNAAGSITIEAHLKADGPYGNEIKSSYLKIEDGTNATTIKCTLVNQWNGDAIAATDNISKSATTGDFTLNASGNSLTIENAGLEGPVFACLSSVIGINSSGTGITVAGADSATDLNLGFYDATAGTGVDLTTLVDTGSIFVYITYICRT